MPPISRKDLHHNFLKKIIVRLDFQGVLEPEMENILLKIKPYAKEKGFSRYEEKITNRIDIAVSQVGIEPPQASANQIRSQKVYSFVDEDRGYVLDVSSSFVCLNITSTRYTPFEEYSEYLSAIAKIYQETIDFFTVKRFGLRKINECLIEDKQKISEYFSPVYFSAYNELPGINTIQSNRANIFIIDQYHVNLISNIVQGVAQGKTLYSILLDLDVYLDTTKDIEELLARNETFQEMNDLLFKIYLHALTEKFKEALSNDGDFAIDDLIGIERND